MAGAQHHPESEGVSVAALDRWVRTFAGLIAARRDHLTELDAAIGDADHGANMDRGMTAAVQALDTTAPTAAGPLLTTVGMTLVSTVGGASGPLFGTFFLRAGTAAGDTVDLTPARFASSLRAGLEGIVARGRAEAGDKTMYDALAPAVDALEAALTGGRPLPDALRRAAAAAQDGAEATSPMLARKGRASYLGERSIGHEDPGAATVALLLRAAASALPRTPDPSGGSSPTT